MLTACNIYEGYRVADVGYVDKTYYIKLLSLPPRSLYSVGLSGVVKPCCRRALYWLGLRHSSRYIYCKDSFEKNNNNKQHSIIYLSFEDNDDDSVLWNGRPHNAPGVSLAHANKSPGTFKVLKLSWACVASWKQCSSAR